jgi:hypothetical protein
MKIHVTLFALVIIALIFEGCDKNEDRLYAFDYVPAPTELAVSFDIAQDNKGIVSIFPSAEGAVGYRIKFGDIVDEKAAEYAINEPIVHTYSEGVYDVRIEALGITGLSSELVQEITVSFKAPENLVIDVENDPVTSKQINISATADYATVIEYLFGDESNEEPETALPGEVVSHTYSNPGDYTIKVVAKGAAIATLDTTFVFTVTEISQPLTAAPEPPARIEADVISIFSDAYADVPDTDYNPDWGQSTIATQINIENNPTLQYANLNYQGTQFGSTVDATGMEYLHVDMWTLNATQVSIFPISIASGEQSVDLPVVAGEWQSYDIPLTDFTEQGLSMADLHQFKVTGTEGSTIFLDNLYFYFESGTQITPTLPLDFESPTIDYKWNDFDGGAVTLIDNPQSSGINTSATVAQMIKSAGQTWGGSWIELDAPIDFSSDRTFSMKVFSPAAGTKVLLKVENGSNGAISYEKEALTTVGNQWEEVTFDYSEIDNSESYQKLVIIFELGTMGDGSADFTYLFDDIELTNK